MPELHGWRPADQLPCSDGEGESDYLMILCAESSAPVIGYYTQGYLMKRGAWISAYGGGGNLHARWWKPLEKVPVSLLPFPHRRFALESGLAFDDEKEG